MIKDKVIILIGQKLIQRLEAEAKKHNPKSSQHDYCLWEAIGVKTRIEALQSEGESARSKPSKRDTTLGDAIEDFAPELAAEVGQFHRDYYGLAEIEVKKGAEP